MSASRRLPSVRRTLSRPDNPLVRAVGRVPASVHRKLLVAFVGSVVLLVVLGVLGLRVVSDSNDRVVTLGGLQLRQAAYTELQADATLLRELLALRPSAEISAYLDDKATAPSPGSLALSDDAIQSTLDDLGPLTAVDKLGFTPTADELTVLARIPPVYQKLPDAMRRIAAADQAAAAAAQAVAVAAANHATDTADQDRERTALAEAQRLQAEIAEPAALDLRTLAQQLVGTTATETTSLIDQNRTAYLDSQHLFIGVAAASVVLALLLGFVMSWSLVGPIRRVSAGLESITAGDFSRHVEVPNRDELGALAANVNRMNDELARLYRELETASRHKSEFLANMSHELRTPLNAIIGFSEVMLDRLFGDVNEKQAEYLADIHSSGRHLLSLINDILDLSKIEAGRMELLVSDFALPELLQGSLALMRERATRQGVGLGLHVDPALGVVRADERRVKQVLFNLLTNAVKFTGRGGHVDIAARCVDDGVVVSVSDDGAGIAPEDQARIFEEFVQAGGSGAQEGTGLGLPLSRRIVELHGGRLSVESAPGRGSTFTFDLPGSRRAGGDRPADALESAEAASALSPAPQPS